MHRIVEFHFKISARERNLCQQRLYCQGGIVMTLYVFYNFENVRVLYIMFFCGLPQFYADRVDDDIEGPFMFLFDLLMNEPAYGISSSFYFQFYGGNGRIGNIADQVIIVDS